MFCFPGEKWPVFSWDQECLENWHSLYVAHPLLIVMMMMIPWDELLSLTERRQDVIGLTASSCHHFLAGEIDVTIPHVILVNNLQVSRRDFRDFFYCFCHCCSNFFSGREACITWMLSCDVINELSRKKVQTSHVLKTKKQSQRDIQSSFSRECSSSTLAKNVSVQESWWKHTQKRWSKKMQSITKPSCQQKTRPFNTLTSGLNVVCPSFHAVTFLDFFESKKSQSRRM